MNKIISVLLNPSIDEIIEIDKFHVGGTFLAKNITTFPVGKAISVAIGIRLLISSIDIPIKVIALIGKDEIDTYSKFLENYKIEHELIEFLDKTRNNKTIIDKKCKTITHIRNKGPLIEKKAINRLKDVVIKNLKVGTFCILSGSIPPNSDYRIYRDIILNNRNLDVKFVLDSSGRSLLEGIKGEPHILKPNLQELIEICPELRKFKISQINSKKSIRYIINKARLMLSSHLNIILITLGKNGAICITDEFNLFGNVQVSDAFYTVGSGDAFLAGFISDYYENNNVLKCFKKAIACGAANTLTIGPGFFKREHVEKLMKKVKVSEIKIK